MEIIRRLSLMIIIALTIGCEQMVGFGDSSDGSEPVVDLGNNGATDNGVDPGSASPGNDGVGGTGGTGGEGGTGEDSPIEYINTLCDRVPRTAKSLQVEFPNPGQTCEWGQNGNLQPLNQYFQARIEKEVVLDLPAGAILCDAEFSFARQEFRYDDHFLFLFNDIVLTASYDFTDRLAQEPQSGQYLYNWSDLVGMYWDMSKETIYCAQFQNYVTSCDFPGHDTQGFIELAIDPNHLQSMMVVAPPAGGHRFRMITIGDNDSLDCEHTGMSFEVNFSYVLDL